MCSPERGPKLTDIAQIIVGLCTDSATSPLSTCTYALHVAGINTAGYRSRQGLSACR
jgi:hypothetical protein